METLVEFVTGVVHAKLYLLGIAGIDANGAIVGLNTDLRPPGNLVRLGPFFGAAARSSYGKNKGQGQASEAGLYGGGAAYHAMHQFSSVNP
jgi:hypothetical protein